MPNKQNPPIEEPVPDPPMPEDNNPAPPLPDDHMPDPPLPENPQDFEMAQKTPEDAPPIVPPMLPDEGGSHDGSPDGSGAVSADGSGPGSDDSSGGNAQKQTKMAPPCRSISVSDFSSNLRGMLTIMKRELFANLFSVRMLVMMLIFVLAVAGGAFAISGLAASNSVSRPDAHVAWTQISDLDGTGITNDVTILITDQIGIPIADAQIELTGMTQTYDSITLATLTTDANGYATVRDLNMQYLNSFSVSHPMDTTYEDTYVYKFMHTTQYVTPGQELYLFTFMYDMDDDNIGDDAIILALDSNATPLLGVQVDVESDDITASGSTDADGIYIVYNLKAKDVEMSFGPGGHGESPNRLYNVSASFNGETATSILIISEDDDSAGGMFDIEGPDTVIQFIAALFITMLIPIIGIVLASDSMNKETTNNSLDFLLSRPLGKKSILIGKFSGIILAISLPVTAINFIAIQVISGASGESPTGSLVLAFLGGTIILAAIFVLLQQIFCTLSKTPGTATLMGISTWMLFSLFWGLISLLVGALAGMRLGSDAWIEMSNQMSLVNPTGAYQFLITQSASTSSNAFSVAGVPDWGPLAMLGVWLFAMLLGALALFQRKAE